MEKYTLTNLIELKKDKTGVHVLRLWLKGTKELNEIQAAKVLSTLTTHILIEAENSESDEEAIEKSIGYKVDTLTKLLNNLVTGRITAAEVKQTIKFILSGERYDL